MFLSSKTKWVPRWVFFLIMLWRSSASDEYDSIQHEHKQLNNSALPESVEVRLSQGTITTKRQPTYIENRYFYAYRGIPFAKPPVGELRFKDPVPSDRWMVPRNGEFIPPQCPQLALEFYTEGKLMVVGEEDCLYLNVFTPWPQRTGNLPVMVWIHGGAFSFGNSSFYNPLPLLNYDVVLVTLQYRLATLGFLSTEDSIIPGNFGLKDQTLALRWIKENIINFGGDADRITLFGQSAGAASVHFQMLTQEGSGLFSQVILQSGTALCPWALTTGHKDVAMKIGQIFNCSQESLIDSRKLLTCVQQIPVKELTLAAKYFAIWHFAPSVMKPRVDGVYLEKHPADLLHSDWYSTVSILSGTTKDEGADYVLDVLSNAEWVSALKENFKVSAPIALRLENELEDPEYMAGRAFYHYLNDLQVDTNKTTEFVKLISDRFYSACQDEASRLYNEYYKESNYGSIYRYKLLHRGQNSYGDPYQNPLSKHWVTHADDLQYLFESSVWPFKPLERTDDLFVRNIILKLWTNFASTGDPTPTKSLGFKWTSMDISGMDYLALQSVPEMKPDRDCKMREFWRNLPICQNSFLLDEDCHEKELKRHESCDFY